MTGGAKTFDDQFTALSQRSRTCPTTGQRPALELWDRRVPPARMRLRACLRSLCRFSVDPVSLPHQGDHLIGKESADFDLPAKRSAIQPFGKPPALRRRPKLPGVTTTMPGQLRQHCAEPAPKGFRGQPNVPEHIDDLVRLNHSLPSLDDQAVSVGGHGTVHPQEVGAGRQSPTWAVVAAAVNPRSYSSAQAIPHRLAIARCNSRF